MGDGLKRAFAAAKATRKKKPVVYICTYCDERSAHQPDICPVCGNEDAYEKLGEASR